MSRQAAREKKNLGENNNNWQRTKLVQNANRECKSQAAHEEARGCSIRFSLVMHYKQVDRNRACCFVRDPSFLTRTKTSLILSSRLNSGSTFAGGARMGFRSIFRPCLNPQDDDGLLLLLLLLIYSLTRMFPQSNCISSATAEHTFHHSATTAPTSLLCSFFFFFFSRDQRHKRHNQGGMHRVPISNLFPYNVVPAPSLYPMDPALLRFL